MTDPIQSTDTSKVTRIEVIDQHGAGYVQWRLTDVVVSLQDDGQTT
jgi:hypothetical protein